MPSFVQLYEDLRSAPDDVARAKLIAEAFERLEERYPHLPDLATKSDLRETELRLLAEIERVRSELIQRIETINADLIQRIETINADLSTRIEKVRGDTAVQIEQVRREIEVVRKEIADSRASIIKWVAGLMVIQLGAIVGAIAILGA